MTFVLSLTRHPHLVDIWLVLNLHSVDTSILFANKDINSTSWGPLTLSRVNMVNHVVLLIEN